MSPAKLNAKIEEIRHCLSSGLSINMALTSAGMLISEYDMIPADIRAEFDAYETNTETNEVDLIRPEPMRMANRSKKFHSNLLQILMGLSSVIGSMKDEDQFEQVVKKTLDELVSKGFVTSVQRGKLEYCMRGTFLTVMDTPS